MLSSAKFCFLIRYYDEEILDFILAASNITEHITVILINMTQGDIAKFKPLYGFDIQAIYSQLTDKEVNAHVEECDKIFVF